MRRLPLALSAAVLPFGILACGDADDAAPVDSPLCDAARDLEELVDSDDEFVDLTGPAERIAIELEGSDASMAAVWVDALERLRDPEQAPILPNLGEVQEAQGAVIRAIEEECPTVGLDAGDFAPVGPANPQGGSDDVS